MHIFTKYSKEHGWAVEQHSLSIAVNKVYYHHIDEIQEVNSCEVISLNPSYVEWLLENAYNIAEKYAERDWFQSEEHTNKDKYLIELDSIMEKYKVEDI